MSATEVVVAEKRCTKCHTVKPLSEFYRNSASRDGRQTQCAECQLALVNERRRRLLEEDPEWFRRQNRRTADRYRRTAEGKRKSRLYPKARNLALSRLAENHRTEYEHLLRVARREVGL